MIYIRQNNQKQTVKEGASSRRMRNHRKLFDAGEKRPKIVTSHTKPLGHNSRTKRQALNKKCRFLPFDMIEKIVTEWIKGNDLMIACTLALRGNLTSLQLDALKTWSLFLIFNNLLVKYKRCTRKYVKFDDYGRLGRFNTSAALRKKL